MATVDQSKGRFRSFLLASLENFLSHQRDKARALRAGGEVRTASLDAPATPELLFERRWSLTVMERAMEQLQAEFGDQPKRFEYGRGVAFAPDGRRVAVADASVMPTVLAPSRRKNRY